ncbi:hypothetical protein L2E82_45233 [Cichorium intybus]|uniref:Uncharacterized protein n=1 Tax=Cichorium intybus TaxID=13427 RepID=A0ACB8ZRG1_CICIN|nr:hypothetical protein L2E82_45233 [Cichorium intybus]
MALQWSEIVDAVNQVVLSNSQDRWRWTNDGSGCFSVASARETIDAVCLPSDDSVVKWSSLAPIKLNVLAWKIAVNGLPIRWNLARRGFDIPSIACVVCEKGGESIDHLFFGCSFVTDLVTGVAKWNASIFSSEKPKKSMCWDSVVSYSFLWIRSRCKNLCLRWDIWLLDPNLAISVM